MSPCLRRVTGGSGVVIRLPMPKLRTPWVKPVSVDPALFVNRSADVERLLSELQSYISYKERSALILLRGERGIGKSIFGRYVLKEIANRNPDSVIALSTDHRGASAMPFFQGLGKKLADEAERAWKGSGQLEAYRKEWLDPLRELSTNTRISRGLHHADGRDYGAAAEFGAGIWGVLTGKGSLQWKERREQGQRTEMSLDVSPDVLQLAINGMLEKLAEDFNVIIFYDDLDQAQNMDNPERAKDTIHQILSLKNCISLLHLRSEVTFPDVRREVDASIELRALQPEELERIVRHRLSGALPPDRALFEESWELFRRFIRVTGNPYVLLRWMVALCGMNAQWPPIDWSSDAALLRLVKEAAHSDISDELLQRLGRLIDALGRTSGIQEQELLKGQRRFDLLSPQLPAISQDELDWLKRYEILVPVDRFDPNPGLRLDPILDLSRASVAAQVRR